MDEIVYGYSDDCIGSVVDSLGKWNHQHYPRVLIFLKDHQAQGFYYLLLFRMYVFEKSHGV